MNITKGITCKAYARKKRTEKILQSMGITTNQWLPCVEPEEYAKIRSAKDVARRVVALSNLLVKAGDVGRNDIVPFLKAQKLWKYVSPQEQEFLQHPNPGLPDINQAAWRVEGLWVLLWALNIISDLGIPDKECSSDFINHFILHINGISKGFIKKAKLRSLSEILDVSDFIYQSNWAVWDNHLYGKSKCGNLDKDVLMEWHHAINWLTCYNDAEWDDVAIDT